MPAGLRPLAPIRPAKLVPGPGRVRVSRLGRAADTRPRITVPGDCQGSGRSGTRHLVVALARQGGLGPPKT